MIVDNYCIIQFIDPSLYEIKSLSAVKVLMKFMEMATDKGEVFLTAFKRVEMCRDLNISNPTISTAIKTLLEKGLISGGNGNYVLSPKIYGGKIHNKIR